MPFFRRSDITIHKKINNKGMNKKRKDARSLLLLCCILLAACFPARAQSPGSVKLTIHFKASGLDAAIRQLKEASPVNIAYDGHTLKLQEWRIQSHQFTQTPLTEILDYLLQKTRLGHKEVAGGIVLFTKNETPVSTSQVTGKIMDEENGQPVFGATVRIGDKGAITGMDGAFSLLLPTGSYTATISYMGYGTKEISGVTVKASETFPLNATLKRGKGQLAGVVVKGAARKESINALLLRQKNAAEVSNGISAEQIARTPDKNIGESLKRISGVSSVDNKFILVRGNGERYNTAMLDGTVLPSTEAQSRNFSFDMIPSNLVDNVIVSKTVTPDMNASFGGGLIQINTKDIPTENFMSIAAGISYNDQSTGKDFLHHKRGKYDYLGFDDGRRDYPRGLEHTDRGTAPNTDLSDEAYQQKVDKQSRRFTHDNFTVYKSKAAPSQNYQFTIGRLRYLDTLNNNRIGFTGSVSYRNTQDIKLIDQQRRSSWYSGSENSGASYGFNTTLGGLLNVGLQLGKSRFSFRNTYTHMYDNALVRIAGYDEDNGLTNITNGVPPARVEEADDPTFTDLLQNKLGGQHLLGKVKVEWNLARTAISRQEKDLGIATSAPVLVGKTYEYFYVPVNSSEPRITPTSRQFYQNKETYYSWDVAVTIPFTLGESPASLKAGYFGNRKEASFDWQIAALSANYGHMADSLRYISIKDMQDPGNIGANGYFYTISDLFLDNYHGKSRSHAGYLMFDNRILDKLRIVWGLRAEYYKYQEIRNGVNNKQSFFKNKPDPSWQWLPSANLTYSPASQINIRAAYSSSVVRPESMDNSQFWRYSPYLGASYGNMGLYSSRISSYDVKAEWFPGLGEIIAIGGFYKSFDKPAELTFSIATGNINYYLKSADWAKVYGLEFEMRKNLGFIAPQPVLQRLFAYGNLTLQQSTVRGTYVAKNPVDGQPDIEVSTKQKRPMYGQTPYLVNAGLLYSGEHLGLNLMYNKTGYKTYIVSENIDNIEYEKPREQLDAQVSYRFLKKRMEIKMNFGNLLNAASVFFINSGSYEVNPDQDVSSGDYTNAKRLKPGFTDKYEEGDEVKFSQKFGRTYSATISYNF
jgi:TonB-dependent receptor